MFISARCISGRRLASQNEMTRPSRATVSVPAAGPYSRTAVKTNASEIEIDTLVPGSSTEAEPLINVSTARRSHCELMGARNSVRRDSPIMRNPNIITVDTYSAYARRGPDDEATAFAVVYRHFWGLAIESHGRH